MSVEQLEVLRLSNPNLRLAENQPERLTPLMTYLAEKIREKTADLEAQGKTIEVMDPEWCRQNPAEAGRMHAEVIIGTYGSTYALPNKDPLANEQAIQSGNLDVYLMRVNGQLTGTTCLVDTGDGYAELGRSASVGRSGNTIIQDLRIFDWLINSDTADKYHTLFTTLRSAPDRTIDDVDGDFIMRGGQAVTEHWRKFPGLTVNGFGPLYLKHGKLEQFTCASISRNEMINDKPLYITDQSAHMLVNNWHDHYGFSRPPISPETQQTDSFGFEAHYPPIESGLTELVHADIIVGNNAPKNLDICLDEVNQAGSPFTQIVLPIDRDTCDLQTMLSQKGYQVFGYRPATNRTDATLLYGKVRSGVPVVPSHWSQTKAANPFWKTSGLHEAAEAIAAKW